MFVHTKVLITKVLFTNIWTKYVTDIQYIDHVYYTTVLTTVSNLRGTPACSSEHLLLLFFEIEFIIINVLLVAARWRHGGVPQLIGILLVGGLRFAR